LIEDKTNLHRLVWSPDDFDGNNLLPSAFRKEDLSGNPESFISVSRIDKLTPKFEQNTANSQFDKYVNDQSKRNEAWSITFNSGELRLIKCSKNRQPFNVTAQTENGNPAHCGIRNISGLKGRSYINELRTLLVSVSKNKIPLTQFLEKLPNE